MYLEYDELLITSNAYANHNICFYNEDVGI